MHLIATAPGDPADQPLQAAWAAGQRCCAPGIQLLPGATGSRRRRLWELDGHAHCPVVGLCLPVAVLRRLVSKVDGQAQADDYDLHCDAVAAGKHRTALAECLQRELDRSHALQVRAAAVHKNESALLSWWEGQRVGPWMAGALWAVLTHARCTPELESRALGQVHMQQHGLGQHQRARADQLQTLQAAHARQLHEQAALQGRLEASLRQQAQQREAMQAELVRLRGQLLVKDALIAQLHSEALDLRRAQPDLPHRKALAAQVSQQNERLRDLQRALDRSTQALHTQATRPAPPTSSPASSPANTACTPAVGAPMLLHRAPPLPVQAQAVLCVGGRTGAVPAYRRLVEGTGARFLHHDGGDAENLQRLDATLGAADLVICQTGCVSHGAYWRVKDHCKRTGTRCLFVDNPSPSSLLRALAQAGEATEPAVPTP